MEQVLGKRRFPENSSGEEEDSETSDDTWNPSEEEEEEEDEDYAGVEGGVRTRSRGPAEVVPDAADAMDKVDEAVDQESDFSSSTEVMMPFIIFIQLVGA
jgi:hypothetical protein